MKRELLFIVCMGILLCAKAQTNLVVNPSFEDTRTCSMVLNNSIIPLPLLNYANITNFPSVTNWIAGTPGTPDYYNSCANTLAPYFGMPKNLLGNQQARVGQAYAGIFAFVVIGSNVFYDEYLETKLSSPLIAGHQYYVSYFVNLATGWLDNESGVDYMGATFSTTQINSQQPVLPLTRGSIINPSGRYITDTTDWVRVDGIYNALGGEEWLTLGSLNRASNPPFIAVVNNRGNQYYSYYYVDDVGVIDLDSAQKSITNVTMCSTDTPYTIKNTHTGAYYLWNTGDTTKDLKVNQSGNYWVRTIFDSVAYMDIVNVTINPYTPLQKPLSDTFLCKGDTLSIGTDNVYDTYQWNTGATTPFITVDSPGKYVLTVSTAFCGTQQDSMDLAVKTTESPTVFDTTVCLNMPVPSLQVIGDSLKWYISTDGKAYKEQPYVSTARLDTFTLYVTETNVCGEGPKVPVHISVSTTTPQITLEDNVHDMLCIGDAVLLQAKSNDISVHYLWNTGETTAGITIKEAGSYWVIGSQQCGSDTSEIKTYTFKDCNVCLSVPNAFTPNNDGLNDYFHAIASCNVSLFSLIVVDRWGHVVYRSNNVQDKWDGTVNGIPQETGTYQYILEYDTNTSHPYHATLTGDITLVR